MGLVVDRVAELRRTGRDVRWRVETVARVGLRLGMLKALRWPGAAALARELAHGRATTSTLFRFYCENDPDRAALVQASLPGGADAGEGSRANGASEARRLSYAEVDHLADRIAAALVRRGLGRGASMLVMLANRIEFFVIALGASRAGVSVVTISWRSAVAEIEYLARDSGAEAMFFDASVIDTVREAAPKLAGIPRRNMVAVGGATAGFPSLEDLVAGAHGAPPRELVRGDDASRAAAHVMYTSGTTGKPKGAVRKLQTGALAAALAFIEGTPMALGEVHLTVCPVYHATATGFSNMVFLLGGTVVVLAEYRPDTFLDAVERYRATSTALVPTMIHRLVELGPNAIASHDTSSLTAIFSGGAPLSGALAIRAMDALGDRLFNFYGATETGLVTLATPADLRAAPGTIGRAIPGNDIRLVDDRGRDVADGEVGELYARNTMLIEGYHADDDATKRSMLGGYFSVGDLARRDAAGRYFIEGRKRDMIISGGVNVYPAEVEAAIESHLSVAEVAVVGAEDREWGERVRAFVVLRAGCTLSEDDLRAHCRALLAGPKIPRDIRFVGDLPRTATGKVLKRELASRA